MTEAEQVSKYNRVLIKLSGEALSGGNDCSGINPDHAEFIATRIKAVHALNVEVAVVIGGGNLWRGAGGAAQGMDRTTADHIGMLATVMNGLALQDAIERLGIPSRVQTAVEMNKVAEPYIRRRAIRHLEKKRVVIFTAGTGSPYFTTDTASALRATEINADLIIKATKVDGVYTADPKLDPAATRFDCLTYQDALDRRLSIMDLTAFTLCMENKMPIMVLDFWETGALEAAVQGDSVGTLITGDC